MLSFNSAVKNLLKSYHSNESYKVVQVVRTFESLLKYDHLNRTFLWCYMFVILYNVILLVACQSVDETSK